MPPPPPPPPAPPPQMPPEPQVAPQIDWTSPTQIEDKRVVDGERQRFTSRILPPYLRKSPKVAEVIPLLYLHGLSTGDFRQALPALLGDAAAGLSPSAVTRLLVAR